MFAPSDMPEPIRADLEELQRMPPLYKACHLGEKNYFASPPPFREQLQGAPLRAMMAQMYGMVTHVDNCVGRILDHLQQRGLMDTTLVVFTTDHGELMGDHGLIFKGPFFFQSLLNIPLIVRMPGGKPGVVPGLAAHVDLVPTVLDCLGLEAPPYLPGLSLKGQLDGERQPARDTVLTEFRPFGGPNMKVLHTDEWKYAYYNGEPWGELFNLADDPQEHVNLYDDSSQGGVRREMHDRLLDELVATEAAWPARGECS
jgi:arylsulfatase A-like enzyme